MRPIRILQVVTYMGRGGIETMLMNYYRNIDRTLIQFDFLTHRSTVADYDAEIERLGGRIYRIPELNPFSNTYRCSLSDFFEQHPEYQIVHCHQDCMSAVILKSAKKHGVKVRIAHSHTSNQKVNLKYLIKCYYKKQIPLVSTDLIACGNVAGQWMFGNYKFEIMHNAIDAKAFDYNPKVRDQVRTKLGLHENDFVIGHVGSFTQVKNHRFLLSVFKEILSFESQAKLILVGDGVRRAEIETEIKDLGVGSSVIMTGMQENVSQYLQAMDVFVMPSLYEGMPVTMVEAQAAGLPCVISDRVPLECKLTDSVVQLSLEREPQDWGAQILAVKKYERKSNYEMIKSAGFDIIVNAKWLENYYLEHWKANK